jgi:hypothetical protein
LEQVRFLSEVRSGRNGVSLAEVARLAEKPTSRIDSSSAKQAN